MTTIRYRLEEAGPVSPALYNGRGHQVATLIDDEQRGAGVQGNGQQHYLLVMFRL